MMAIMGLILIAIETGNDEMQHPVEIADLLNRLALDIEDFDELRQLHCLTGRDVNGNVVSHTRYLKDSSHYNFKEANSVGAEVISQLPKAKSVGEILSNIDLTNETLLRFASVLEELSK